jgi:hypothetical protein
MPEYELVITFTADDGDTAKDVGRRAAEQLAERDSQRLLGGFRYRTQLGQSFPYADESKLSQSTRTQAYAIRKILEQFNALPDVQGADAADLARRVLANARDLVANYEPSDHRYALAIEGGLHPTLLGPYTDDERFHQVATATYERQDPETDTVLFLTVDFHGRLHVDYYSEEG